MLRLNGIYQHQSCICLYLQTPTGYRRGPIQRAYLIFRTTLLTTINDVFERNVRKFCQLVIILIVFSHCSVRIDEESALYILGPRTEYIRMYMI